MDKLLRLIASPGGRVARIAVGTILIGTGLAKGRQSWGLTAAGLLPLAMGAFDWCLLSPLAGLPFEGQELRTVLGPVPKTAGVHSPGSHK
ncbi:DUF2892 domain-containing protein [Hymenobacter taeanensis]|uniref:DUF2892 domain-containing protein n=1 Tax=Hymenobacter taeanensis TaxID=2735321 RepID=A0A6M6BIS3_9BACT|nr:MULTISPECIES: DUF2892 domain-containing protein [Hymenobacter]QJX47788.1 DUF2892 domain-containing protein [Hymenobacter taeanensis]UOQ82724.1 DUF2892 domain-containing protein [Hymenobacter sp. 5414T-23]